MKFAQLHETPWEQLKRKLKHKFIGLLYSNLAYEENRQDRMFKNLRTKLGKSKKDFAAIVAGA